MQVVVKGGSAGLKCKLFQVCWLSFINPPGLNIVFYFRTWVDFEGSLRNE